MQQKLRWLSYGFWGGIGAIATIAGLIWSIYTYAVPNLSASSNLSSPTSSPVEISSPMPTATPTPVPTPTPTPLPPTPTPAPQPTPIPYPHLSSIYQGTGYNITVSESGSLMLSSITEDQQGNISGQTTWGSPLCGSGSFTGNVNTNDSISFTNTTTDGSACEDITTFTGTIDIQNNSMSGNYTTATQKGT